MSLFGSRRNEVVTGRAVRELSTGRRPPPGVVRAVDRSRAVELGRGMVQASRVQAVEYVADQAMHAAGRLAQSEAFWFKHAPHGAGRYQAIADLAAMALADIVAETGRE